MRLGVLTHIIVNVVVVGGAWHRKLLLSLVDVVVLLTARTPSTMLQTVFISLSSHNGVWLYIVTWAGTINFLGFEMGFRPEGRIESRAIGAHMCRWPALVIESTTKLVLRTTRLLAISVLARSREVLCGLCNLFVTRRLGLRVWVWFELRK